MSSASPTSVMDANVTLDTSSNVFFIDKRTATALFRWFIITYLSAWDWGLTFSVLLLQCIVRCNLLHRQFLHFALNSGQPSVGHPLHKDCIVADVFRRLHPIEVCWCNGGLGPIQTLVGCLSQSGSCHCNTHCLRSIRYLRLHPFQSNVYCASGRLTPSRQRCQTKCSRRAALSAYLSVSVCATVGSRYCDLVGMYFEKFTINSCRLDVAEIVLLREALVHLKHNIILAGCCATSLN